VPVIATIIATIFLPGLFLGVISCWHKNMFKTIVAHPSVVLMPTFTHFAFESSTKWCRKGEEEGGEEEKTTRQPRQPFIRFSPKFTIVNIILSIAGNVVYGISMTYMGSHTWGNIFLRSPFYLEYYLLVISIPILGLLLTLFSLLFLSNSSNCIHSTIKYTLANLIFNTAAYQVFFSIISPRRFLSVENIYFLPVPIFGLLVTILKIILNRCNINLPTLTCFSLPRVEYGALVCSDPQGHYVLDADGNPKQVIEEKDEVDRQNEVLEMVDNTVETGTITSQREETVEVVLDQQAVEVHHKLTVLEA